MESEQLAGKIKTILRPVVNPKQRSLFLIKERLTDAHHHLLLLKGYDLINPDLEKVYKAVCDKEYKPWFDDTAKLLSSYLGVIILKKKVLVNYKVDPINTYFVISDKNQVKLTYHYINYLYDIVSKLSQVNRETHKNEARKIRRFNNRNEETKEKLVDTRTFSSLSRDKNLKMINRVISDLLEDIEINHTMLHNKDLYRLDQLEYLTNTKYKTWDHTILKKS